MKHETVSQIQILYNFNKNDDSSWYLFFVIAINKIDILGERDNLTTSNCI